MSETLALPKISSLWEVYPPAAELQAILRKYAAGSRHLRDMGLWGELVFQFNIKIHRLDIPEWAREHVGDLDAVVLESFSDSLTHFDEYIKEQYSWVKDCGTTGHSGGWLAVFPDDPEMLVAYMTHDDVTTGDEEEGEFDVAAIAQIAHDVVEIDQLVGRGQQDLQRLLSRVQTWREYNAGGGSIPSVWPAPTAVTASETYFDSSPALEDVPEERTFVNEMDDRKLRRTNPKRYDPRADQYIANNMEGHDSPVENRYDDAPSLTAGLRTNAFIKADILDALAPIDWEIHNTIEASRMAKQTSMTGESWMAKLMARFMLFEALKRTASPEEVPYSAFPQIVRAFVDQKFADIFQRYPDVKDFVKQIRVEFTPRPAHAEGFPGIPVPKSTGAEYFTGDNVIRYYLPRETLEKHWRGIVHEITHVIQEQLKGTESTIPPPPNDDREEYYTDHNTYRQDPGEVHAYRVQDEFVQFLKEQKEHHDA